MAPIIGKIEKVENTFVNEVISYKWIISDFFPLWSSLENSGQFVSSLHFDIVGGGETFLCHFELYPKGDCLRYKNYLIAKLVHDRQSQEPLNTDVIQMSILNDKNSIISQQKTRKPTFQKKKHYTFLLIDIMSLMEPRNQALVDGSLVIQFDLIFDVDVLMPSIFHPTHNLIEGHHSKSNEDFEQLLDNQKFSDVKFTLGVSTIYSHKVILTTRSQVFRAMFEHQMEENKHGVVDITDVSYDVMKELLRFMYANKVNGIEKMAKELLVAADKYSMDDLKALCEKSLYNSLNVNNAIEYLVLTCSCNTFQLKSQVIQFINDNPDIVDQPEFKTLDSDIMYEVVRTVTRKRMKH